jgi:pilus assembly protein CpaC
MKRRYEASARSGRAWLCLCIGMAHAFTATAQTAATQAAALPALPSAPTDNDPKNGFAEMLKPSKPARAARGVTAGSTYAPIQSTTDDGQIAEIEMFVGESRVFPAPGVARIAVGNGSLLTAAALDGKEVILFANTAGTSSLFIWNADGRYQRVKINIVPGDTSRHAREIAAFLSTIPRTKASIVGANIIVEGDQLADADLQKVEELTKRYPQIVNFTHRVGWERMVSIDVKVVEFPTSVLREMGLKWSSTGGAALGGIWGPGRRGHDGPYQINVRTTGEATATPIIAPTGPVIVPSGLNLLSVLNMGLNAQLNLLAQEGGATLLAEPQLSTRSGSKAKFIAGGEIPYAVSTRDGIAIAYKEYGVKLDITPTVDPQGGIRATISTEVSSVDRSITSPGGPALLKRKTDTEFNVQAGETIVLSGLLQRESGTDIDKLPVLGDLPVLGALFRSKRYQNKETELVVFVTPTVMSPQSPGQRDRIERTTERLQERLGAAPYLSDPLQPGVAYEKPDAVPARAKAAEAGPTPLPVPAASPKPIVAPIERAAPVVPAAPALPPTVQKIGRAERGALLTVVADNAVLRAAPSAGAAALLSLERGASVVLGAAALQAAGDDAWRHVQVGRVQGWVPTDAVLPLHTAQAAPTLHEERAQPARKPVTATALPRPVLLASKEFTPDSARPFRVEAQRLALRLAPDVNAGAVVTLLHGDVVNAITGAERGHWIGVQSGSGESAQRGWVPTQWLLPLAKDAAAN